jgi:two-component system KDP operon response regulator KdpE
MDGKDVLANIRSWSNIPVIILSVRSKEEEKIQALDMGADDYLTKPFGVGELMARIRTALRHQYRQQNVEPEFHTGDLVVDLVKRRVLLKDEEIHLSKKEYQILALFVQHAGMVLTHQHILRTVWGEVYSHDTAYLRVFIRQLRNKIEPDPTHPVYIITESGVGYRLQAADE